MAALGVSPTSASAEKVSFGIDSGAAVTAIPRALGADYPITEKPSGAKYLSATGETISDEGQRKLMVQTGGTLRGIKGRVTGVRRPLLSVFDMVKSGHRVVFEPDIHETSNLATHIHVSRTRTCCDDIPDDEDDENDDDDDATGCDSDQ